MELKALCIQVELVLSAPDILDLDSSLIKLSSEVASGGGVKCSMPSQFRLKVVVL